MTRRLCYDVSFHNPAAAGAQIVLRLALARIPPNIRAQHSKDMANTIPYNTIRPALAWFQAMAGTDEAIVPVLLGNDVIIPLPSCVTAQWQVAVLLNMIDFALAEDEAALKLISSAKVFVPSAAKWTELPPEIWTLT